MSAFERNDLPHYQEKLARRAMYYFVLRNVSGVACGLIFLGGVASIFISVKVSLWLLLGAFPASLVLYAILRQAAAFAYNEAFKAGSGRETQ